jgi:6-phosphogluconolactonase
MLGNGLTLQINGGSPLPLAANGAFTFATSLLSGTSYVVTVATQPSNPPQTCVLGGASGSVQSAAITKVLVTCTSAPTQFAYGGTHAGIYCFAVDAISGALAPLAEPQCDSGQLVAVAADPVGPFVYATDSTEVPGSNGLVTVAGSVRMYRIDPTTGQLVRLSAIEAEPPTSEGPLAIAVDPTGSFVYVGASDSVSAYTIDPTTGLLTALPGSPFPAAGGYIDGLAIASSGKFLYTANGAANSVSALAIDATTGRLTQVPGSPFAAGEAPATIAVDPASRFVFVANLLSGNVSVFQIDSATGALSPVPGSPFTAPCPPASMTTETTAALDTSGAFLFVLSGCVLYDNFTDIVENISVFSIDRSTGALAALPSSPVLSAPEWANGTPPLVDVGPFDLTVWGHVLYVANGNGTVSMFAIDEFAGRITQISGSPIAAGSGTALYNLAFGW